jgi:hypothetical protein
MTIDRLVNVNKRAGVAWLGAEPPEDARSAFVERGFRVASCTPAELTANAYVAGLAAVVFTQSEAEPVAIARELRQYARRLLDFDCRVIVRAAESAKLDSRFIIARALNALPTAGLGVGAPGRGEPPLPHARVYGPGARWPEIANFLLEHQPGPAPNLALRIAPPEVIAGLPRGCATLLRRAFWDCSEVHLQRMSDGRSGVGVYLAHPELAKGHQGRLAQWPLPYFLKIGDRDKVLAEYVNYEEHVDPYIPFHLGPHLIRQRCCLGGREGLLVGDFVEESESLIDCARSGRAAQAIACLFNRTLAGWYRGAQEDKLDSAQLGRSFLRRFPRSHEGLRARVARARELGATKTLDELRGLFQKCDSLPVLVGAIHGDLHAGNVRVRATDAILIDFFAHQTGPLVYDAACLEASLLVDGFDTGERLAPGEMSRGAAAELDARVREWMESVATLYDHVPLQALPIHPNPKNPACWFHACVRQIRLFAKQMESGDRQYAAALAVALLTKATKDLRAPEPEASRRAAAYVLAERVLLCAFQNEEKEG